MKLYKAVYDLCAFLYGCHASIKSLFKETKGKTSGVAGRVDLTKTRTRNSQGLESGGETGKQLRECIRKRSLSLYVWMKTKTSDSTDLFFFSG